MAKSKVGNINILVFTIVAMIVIVIIFAFCINYIQVTSMIMNIKNDLYNIAQNGIIANDKTNLALNNYITDKNIMKNNISNILTKNYLKSGGSIKEIEIEECDVYLDKEKIFAHTNRRYDETIIHLKIKIIFKPIIKIKGISDSIYINIHEDVKATLLQYGGV